MSLILNVPFNEKDEAKALGARWDAQRKVWYAPFKKDYHKFFKWINNSDVLVTDYFYIMTSTKECFRCHTNVQVIGFAYDKFYYYDEDTEQFLFRNEFTWMSSLKDEYSKDAQNYLLEKYNFKHNYSKVVKNSYYSVTCPNCGVIQGANYLFDDDSSIQAPFSGVDDEVSKRITLIKVNIPYAFPANFGWMGDCNILDNATVVECEDKRVGEYFCQYN